MESQHMVLFPFMAQGHLIPFLALAKLIEQRNPSYTITLVNTPLNIRNLHSSLPPHSNIHLKALPFQSSDHGLPPDSENTNSLPMSQICRLLQASQTLQPHFDRFVSDITRDNNGRTPLCIIADIFLGWTSEIARELGIFHTTFITCGAYGQAVYLALWLHLPHSHTDSSEFNIPGFPETFRLHRSQLSQATIEADGTDPLSIFLQKLFSLCLRSDAMICNTIKELEPVGIELLRKSTGLRLWTIGPLLSHARKKPMIELEDCIVWLDARQPGSVIYVSFGSQNTISASQMMELAMGLEASGKPFIWVVRPPLGFDLNEDFREEWLPEGFEVRMKERRQGLIVRKWAPQMEILSHRSIGAFLSHCGWNSVLESLSQGVPIIAWPLSAEQFFNSKMLGEELGVCVELARGVKENIARWEVEKMISLVMSGGGIGKEMKEKAVGCAEKIRASMREDGDVKGSSITALDDFIETVLLERHPTGDCG